VIVVEAAPRSGALVTAKIARGLNVPVLACPGSAGTAALLAKRQAVAVESAEDVEALLRGETVARAIGGPPPALAALVAALAEEAADAAALARRLGRPLGEIMATLTEAELEGWVRRGAANRYEVGHGH
jgi:DNA processing protein